MRAARPGGGGGGRGEPEDGLRHHAHAGDSPAVRAGPRALRPAEAGSGCDERRAGHRRRGR
eukprot:1933250-Rhodomonas_salina.1